MSSWGGESKNELREMVVKQRVAGTPVMAIPHLASILQQLG